MDNDGITTKLQALELILKLHEEVEHYKMLAEGYKKEMEEQKKRKNPLFRGKGLIENGYLLEFIEKGRIEGK